MSASIYIRASVVALALFACAGCAGLGDVKPWQKGTLAKSAMAIDANTLEARYAVHVATSKEAASGGTGVGGGGCGCN